MDNPFTKLFNHRPQTGEVAIADIFGTHLFGPNSGIRAYNPSQLVTRRGLRIFDEMRKDEQVRSAMSFKQSSVMASGWSLHAPEGRDDDWDVLEFVQKQFDAMGKGEIFFTGSGFGDKVIEILSSMEYGFSVTEKIWLEEDGAIRLSDLKTRAPHNMEFDIDAHGNITGLTQSEVPLPVPKFLVHVYDSEFQNPYGCSDLESAYRAWWSKSNAYKWLAMLLEKHGIPPIFYLYNPAKLDQSSQGKLRTIMERIQAATVGLIPRSSKDDGEMWSPDLASNVDDVFIPSLNKFDQDIAKAILVPGLLGFTSDTQEGSYARAGVHFDAFMLIVQKVRESIECLVNNGIVRNIVDFNFHSEEYPLFKLNPLTEDVTESILSTWNDLITGKVVNPQQEDERHIREALKFPPMSEETETQWDDPEPDEDEEVPPELDPEDGDEEPELIDAEMGLYANRPLNTYEQKVDFAQVVKGLDGIEAQALETLTGAMKQIQDRHIEHLRKSFKPEQKWVRDLDLRGFQRWRLDLEETMRVNLDYGRERLRMEVPRAFSERGPAFVPSEAIAELKTRALDKSASVKGRLLDQIKNILINGIATGSSLGDMIPEIQAAFLPYIGNPNILKNGEPLSSHSIENIVRTESTRAFNRGRLVEIRSKEARNFIQGVEYSSVIDSRTTPVCRHLDGKIFAADSDDLTGLTPPNHYMCRSVLVPVLIDEPVDQSEMVTPAEVGRGKQLAGKGFV